MSLPPLRCKQTHLILWIEGWEWGRMARSIHEPRMRTRMGRYPS